MGTKTFRYAHTLGKAEALKRGSPLLDNLAKKYMMKREDTPDGALLKGKGVDAKVVVTDDAIEITMEMSFLIEKIAGAQVESELNYKVPKALG
jgi:putative polyhydroxyalkanoate system protein